LSVNRRTIARGQQLASVRPDKPAVATLRLAVPGVKEGVVVQAQLAVSLYAGASTRPAAEHTKPIWIFPRDPFVDRSEWLKGLNIELFDPLGKTAEVFEKARVPFKLTRNTAAISGPGTGLLVIGEGISLRDFRALPEAMLQAAAGGRPVLCLAPSEGAIPMPGAGDTPQQAPRLVELRREDIVTELDKRVDAAGWPPAGTSVASRLVVQPKGGRVVAEVSAQGAGWPWLDARYPAGRGRLLACGFGIIRQWEDGPAPRFLLARILDLLDGQQDSSDRNNSVTLPTQTNVKE
jgi:hypothetical protein